VKEINVDEWLKSGEYLPDVMRDFHYQKNLFRAMHEIIQERQEDMVKRPSWVAGHCYVVDVFLWFMARHGYTLQRTRRRGNFRDLNADIEQQTKLAQDAAVALFTNRDKVSNV
jgi:hypothetical protein